MTEIVSTRPAAVARDTKDLPEAPSKLRGKMPDVPVGGVVRATSSGTASAQSLPAIVCKSTNVPRDLALPVANSSTNCQQESNESCLEDQRLQAAFQAHPAHGDAPPAGTRQGDLESSNATMQSSLAFKLAAGSKREPIGKRPGDDDSDDGGNGHGKRQRLDEDIADGQAFRFRCHFDVRYADNPEIERCHTYQSDRWHHYVQHCIYRAHKPQDQCQNCGDLFKDQVEWDRHTGGVLECEQRPTWQWERPICVTRDQANEIRRLTTRGSRTRPLELWPLMWRILFDNIPVPDRVQWLIPQSNRQQIAGSVQPVAPGEEPIPHNPGGQPGQLALEEPLSPSSFLPSPAFPDVPQNTDVQPAQSPATLDPPSAALTSTYANSTALQSSSTEITPFETNTDCEWEPEWDDFFDFGAKMGG